jgi:hypothetical protein
MKFAALALCCFAAFAQGLPKQDAVIALANTPAADAVKQMSTALQVVAEIQDWSFDKAHSSFRLNGRTNVLGAAQWLLHVMDKPVGWRPSLQEATNLSSLSYHIPGDYPGDKWKAHVRAYYLTNPANRLDLLEILTIVRVVGKVLRAVECEGPPMIILSGSDTEVNLGEWIVRKLDVPAGAEAYAHQKVDPEAGVLKLSDAADGKADIVRVFYLDPETPPKSTGELVSRFRASTHSLQIFWRSSPPAIMVRGSSELVAVAQQIIEGR